MLDEVTCRSEVWCWRVQHRTNVKHERAQSQSLAVLAVLVSLRHAPSVSWCGDGVVACRQRGGAVMVCRGVVTV